MSGVRSEWRGGTIWKKYSVEAGYFYSACMAAIYRTLLRSCQLAFAQDTATLQGVLLWRKPRGHASHPAAARTRIRKEFAANRDVTDAKKLQKVRSIHMHVSTQHVALQLHQRGLDVSGLLRSNVAQSEVLAKNDSQTRSCCVV